MVSIIIPCYNYGWLLAETLDSVSAQLHQNWECFIVDDGSIDSTRDVALQYAARDQRFHYLYQENKGLSAARNLGLQAAQGTYIQLLDADDLLVAGKLSIQIDFLIAHPEVDIVYGEARYFLHTNPQQLSRSFDMKDQAWMLPLHGVGLPIIEKLIESNRLVVSAPLFKRSLLKKVGLFTPALRSMEDWEFWLRCAIAGAYFHYDSRPDTMTLIRVHGSSLSQNTPRMQLFVEQVRASLVESLDSTGLSEAAALNKELLQQQRHHNAQQLLRNGELKLGLGKYWQLARESGHYLLYLREVLYILRHTSV